jgi:hypothetical protein
MLELDWKAWGAPGWCDCAGVVSFLSARLRLHLQISRDPALIDGRPLRGWRLHRLSSYQPLLGESKVPPETVVCVRLVTLLVEGLQEGNA